MTKTPMRAASDLEAGWTALGEGRWVAARTSFEEALAERETPEAFEGLSWAAWWLDDALICFPTRVVGTPAGGSAYTFTMFQAPGQPDEQFERQHASLLREFENLERRFGSAT